MQQAVWVLRKWAGVNLPDEYHFSEDYAATTQAKKKLNWVDVSTLIVETSKFQSPCGELVRKG